MTRYLYSELASTVQARLNCIAQNDPRYPNVPRTLTNPEWYGRHTERIESLVSEHMPSGSGFDSGTKIDLERSHADRLVFTTSYHHIDESGCYDGWTEHTVTVTPSLLHGFNLRISGRNRNDIKEYIGEEFHHALMTDLTDQIAYERLAQALKHGLTYRANWIDSCTQEWNVYGPVAGVETLVKSGFRSWIEARRFAVEYMTGLEQTGKGI